MPGLCVGDRETGADGQSGELIDRITAGAPVRKLLFLAGRRLQRLHQAPRRDRRRDEGRRRVRAGCGDRPMANDTDGSNCAGDGGRTRLTKIWNVAGVGRADDLVPRLLGLTARRNRPARSPGAEALRAGGFPKRRRSSPQRRTRITRSISTGCSALPARAIGTRCATTRSKVATAIPKWSRATVRICWPCTPLRMPPNDRARSNGMLPRLARRAAPQG
jgi:hypothetical protein